MQHAWNFCIAAKDGDTFIKTFAFAVNSISSKKGKITKQKIAK